MCLYKVEVPSNQAAFALEAAAFAGLQNAWLVFESGSGSRVAFDVGASIKGAGGSLGGLTTPVQMDGLGMPPGLTNPLGARLLGELAGASGSTSLAGSVPLAQ